MPRPRKENVRAPQIRLIIICEGKKTEVNYFESFRDNLVFPGDLVEIKVIHTGKTSNRELVRDAISLALENADEPWVVVDKDGYTKHHEAFQIADANSVKIAFSSICFEVWVALHFEYSSKPYAKCADVIRMIKTKHGYDYEKNNEKIFNDLRSGYDRACSHAKRLRNEQERNFPGVQIYDINPYTNVDLLTERLVQLKKEICAKKNS